LVEFVNDIGIVFEIAGFVLILLVAGRNTKGGSWATEDYEPSKFDTWREKIIPGKHVDAGMIVGIGFVILGLIMQFSFLI